MYRRATAILLFFLTSITGYAQDSLNVGSKNRNLYQFLFSTKDKLTLKYDTNRIDPMLDKVTLRLFVTGKLNEQRFKDDAATNVWRTNDTYRLGVGFGYRWLILNFALYGPFSHIDESEKGKTTSLNLQVNVYGRAMLFDFRTQWYKGYFLMNSQSIIPGWEDNKKFFLRPDIGLFAVGGNLRYNFNHGKFSFKNSYDQTQIMKKSGGAFEAGFRFSYQYLWGDSSFTYQMNQLNNLTGLESGNFGLGAGYTYTLVFGKYWFLTGTVNPYVNLQNITMYRDQGNISNHIVPNFTTIFRGAAGYTTPDHYIGVTWVWDRVTNRYNNTDYDYTYTVLKLIYAYRFTSKWWKSKGL